MTLKYLVVSDIHLGAVNTPTEHIIANLTRELTSNDKKDLDVMFLAGDVFDRLLDFNAEDVQCIVLFLYSFLNFCSVNDIKVRVLEGTSSHDWRQSKIFLQINAMLYKPCDILYHTSLTIEYIADHDVHVLYIPDNWISSDAQLHRELSLELLEKNVSKVDIAIMHGHFKYQSVGMHTKEYGFDEAFFLSLVKNFIHVGHFHTHTHYERIVAQGSFDRLRHGEEEKKGYVVACIDKVSNTRDWVFCENKNAYTYKTIKITPSIDIGKLDKILSKYPKDSYIRLLIDRSHPLNIIFEKLRSRYVDCHLTKKISNKSEDKLLPYIENDSHGVFDQLVLNEANLTKRLQDQIVDKEYDLTDKHWTLFNTYMKG